MRPDVESIFQQITAQILPRTWHLVINYYLLITLYKHLDYGNV
jgi:hypothetical protein